jgi:hypothetical protein
VVDLAPNDAVPAHRLHTGESVDQSLWHTGTREDESCIGMVVVVARRCLGLAKGPRHSTHALATPITPPPLPHTHTATPIPSRAFLPPLHAQPRRVAAMSVAKRVAEEMGVELGQEVRQD